MKSFEKIIDYRDLLEKSTKGFVGRSWAREAVDQFLLTPGPRYFLILGEPGSGKTAFLADLVRQRSYPHHFIGKGSLTGLIATQDWRDPVRFAESIGCQLLRDYGGWIMRWDDWGIQVDQKVRELEGLLVGAEVDTVEAMLRPENRPLLSVKQEIERFGPAAQIIGVYIEHFVMDPEQVVRQLLVTPLKSIAERWPDRSIVVVIDGLDEADSYSNPVRNILKLLPDGNLPTNVRFLLSSRPGEHLTTDFLTQTRTFWLSEDPQGKLDPHAMDDAIEFVRQLGQEPLVEELLRQLQPQIEPAPFAQAVAKASEGNFLYLYHYAQGLRTGDKTLLDLRSLPVGLYGIYHDFLVKVKESRDPGLSWNQVYKAVLGTLAVAQEPLFLSQIAHMAQIDRETVGTILAQIEPFLDKSPVDQQTRYTLYHPSFGEYLISDKNEDVIDAQKAHLRIVNSYRGKADTWEQILWDQVDDYGLRHLVFHLYALKGSRGDDQRLFSIFCKSYMQAKHLRFHSYESFALDIDLAWQALAARGMTDENVLLLTRLQTIRQIIRWEISEYGDVDLRTLVLLGREQEALAHARLRRLPIEHFDGIFAIYCELEERSGFDIQLYSEMLRLANSLPGDSERATAFEKMLPRFPSNPASANDEDDYEALLKAVLEGSQQISPLGRAEPLVGLAERVGASYRADLTTRVVDQALPAINEQTFQEFLTEWLARLAIALTLSGASKKAQELWEAAEAIITDWDTPDIHILAMAAARLTRMLYDNGRQEQALQLALLIEGKILHQAANEHFINDVRPAALSWLGAMWLHLGDQQRGEGIFSDVNDLLLKLMKAERGKRSVSSGIVQAMLWAGRFKQAWRYRALLGQQQEILVAHAQAAVADGADNAAQILKKATQAVLAMRKTSPEREWAKVFNQLLHVLGQSGQLVHSDWCPFYEDGEALSIQAYWTARAGGKEQAAKLLEMALHAKSSVDVASWNNTLQHVAQGLARGGNLMQAQPVIKHISGTPQRLTAMMELGRGFAHARLNNEADTCFEEATRLAAELHEDPNEPGYRDLLFQAIIETGRQQIIEDLLASADEQERDRIRLPFFRVMLIKRDFEMARALLDQNDYYAQVLADALIDATRPAEAKAFIETRGLNVISMKDDIKLGDDCYLNISWGRILARLAGCLVQQQELEQGEHIVGILRANSEANGDGPYATQMLADLGRALAEIGRNEEAATAFQQAEESVAIDGHGTLNSDGFPYLLESLASSGFVSRMIALSERILEAEKSMDDAQNSLLQECAWVCSKAGLSEYSQKFLAKLWGSDWKRGTFIALSHEAIRQGNLSVAVQLAFDWPGWMENEHWAEMLTPLANALVDDQRFDELKNLIPLAKEAHLRYNLLAQLAAGLARAGRIREAYEIMERTDLEHLMIFLSDSSTTFDQIRPGLSLLVLQEATTVAGWVRQDWNDILDLLTNH